MAQGYGYQPTDISTPIPNADLGSLNVRANVAEAGAGMDKIAQAGKEAESVADKIQRQENMTAVLKAKNSSATEINQAWLDFQPKMTGNIQQDQAAWDAISSKIGQKYLAQLGNPTQQQSFTKEFDALHKASIIQVQNQSLKTQRSEFDTASAGLLVNATKGAFATVKAGSADYANQVEQQFKNYADVINASPLMSQAEKDSRLQAARQHFYMEVAKYQAEATPGAFSRDWRDGVWTKNMTPEAVTQLQPFAQTAEITNAVRALQSKFPGNPAAAVREALSPEYGAARGYTEEQQRKVAGYFEGVTNFNWQQHERAKSQAAEAGLMQIARLLTANDIDGLGKLANSPSASPAVAVKAAELFRSGQTNWRGDDATYKDALSKALTGDISASDILGKAGPNGLSMEQAVRVIGVLNKTPQEDKENFALALKEFSVNNGDKEQQAKFMAALKFQAEKEGAHGEAILYLGDKLGKDTSWVPFVNGAPYVKLYEDMQSVGAVRTKGANAAAPAQGGTIEERAASFLRQNGKLVNPETVKTVIDRGLVK